MKNSCLHLKIAELDCHLLWKSTRATNRSFKPVTFRYYLTMMLQFAYENSGEKFPLHPPK